MQYFYFVNLDERGEFFADVRTEDGATIFTLHTEDAVALVEDGFLKNPRDASQIEAYLIEAEIIDDGDTVEKAN